MIDFDTYIKMGSLVVKGEPGFFEEYKNNS